MNKKKYTIAQILPALNTGGVERGVVEISKALVENNFRSVVISSGGHMVSQITRYGGIHYDLDVATKNPLKWPKIRNELKKILESENVDLIHFCSRAPAWIGVPLGVILDIPIIGTEVIAKHPYSVAECISTRVVDMVRADVSWSGGITATMKTAHLAESFGVQCEIHTAIYHPLELVNLHCCAAIKNSEFFEVLVPYDYFDFGLKDKIKVENGSAQLPSKPGLGIELDWDFIDNTTFKKF